MAIDIVHDTQFVFRKILDSMARPGTVANVTGVASRIDTQLNCFHSTFLCALTLLDSEVTFHVLPTGNSNLIDKISQYTLSKHVSVSEADFIIASKECSEQEAADAIRQAKQGTLIDPNRSSTIILEVESLTEKEGTVLTGPGIKTKSHFPFAFSKEMFIAREEKNKEFPMGIDLIITDSSGRLACIPRTAEMDLKEGR
ncbi:phosphonate C-P lyase system protein PhnH [Bacillus sp. CRN 9]|uniref:phosphonate C-P lyase system protein PhnH n=1 Tax=Cytobacillus horneckiae TaxID=549687 RepID=UPI001562B0C0|nr:phosphonate C-P lyase system protein PhnH [Bacillus sp. CRN 9]